MKPEFEFVGRVDCNMKETGEYVLTTPLRIVDAGKILRLHLALLAAEAERLPKEAKLDEAARARARAAYQREGLIEVDEGAPISRFDGGAENGCYVQAWLWVDE